MKPAVDYRQGAERLLNHLANEFDAEGASLSAPDNVQFYYKMPATFAYAGQPSLALRTLEQFEKRFLENDRLNFADDPMADTWVAYIAGWVGWGAGVLGRFDVAKRVMNAVGDSHHGELGGYVHQSPMGLLYDTERSSAAAMGLIWSAQVQPALDVARFLKYAIDLQPKPVQEFHTYFDLNGQVRPDLADRNAFFSVDDLAARPALFATSIASLVWLGRISTESRFFDLAHRYMNFVLLHKDPACLPLATKIGWAALMLSAHTNDERLIEFARRCGDCLLDRQEPSGAINFDNVPDVPRPVDKVWLLGWGCDAFLTLWALAN
jgi:hypothetical protein